MPDATGGIMWSDLGWGKINKVPAVAEPSWATFPCNIVCACISVSVCLLWSDIWKARLERAAHNFCTHCRLTCQPLRDNCMHHAQWTMWLVEYRRTQPAASCGLDFPWRSSWQSVEKTRPLWSMSDRSNCLENALQHIAPEKSTWHQCSCAGMSSSAVA